MSFLNPSQVEARRRRILVGGASLVLTSVIMTAFMLESRSGYSGRVMNVIYMQNWSAQRSRADTLADAQATAAARAERLAQSRTYIATLTGPARTKAQEQYDAYVAGGGVEKDIPFVITAPASDIAPIIRVAPASGAAPANAAALGAAAEPPVN
ncbi:MAG: hypothetical protein ACOYKQ_11315 [Polymorphobacter sp.]|jgi:hypothetical protein